MSTEHKRLHLESSKQNYYIIALRAIIKAIFTSLLFGWARSSCHAPTRSSKFHLMDTYQRVVETFDSHLKPSATARPYNPHEPTSYPLGECRAHTMLDPSPVVSAPRFAATMEQYLIQIQNPEEILFENLPAKILYWVPWESIWICEARARSNISTRKN